MNRTIQRARDLGRDGSLAERKCWELLRAHRLSGLKFRRQHPVGRYFADFACPAKMLIIEIDGNHHADRAEADARRTADLQRQGWKVIRFAANEVVQNPEGIWAAIQLEIDPSRNPLS